MNNQYRNTYVEINLSNIYENYKSIQNKAKNVKIMPVVKADAYGHGAVEVTRYLVSKGVDQFCVSLLEEAIELRNIFPEIQILVMGIVEKNGLLIASENDITCTISNMDQLKLMPKLKKRLKIHLNIDSGMNRLGFKNNQEILEVMEILKKNKFLEIEGIYSHFSTADVDKSYYDIQMKRFIEVLEVINYRFKMIHLSNSSSVIKYENIIDASELENKYISDLNNFTKI